MQENLNPEAHDYLAEQLGDLDELERKGTVDADTIAQMKLQRAAAQVVKEKSEQQCGAADALGAAVLPLPKPPHLRRRGPASAGHETRNISRPDSRDSYTVYSIRIPVGISYVRISCHRRQPAGAPRRSLPLLIASER